MPWLDLNQFLEYCSSFEKLKFQSREILRNKIIYTTRIILIGFNIHK